MVEETTICLQCGDRGYENAFVFCIRCLNFAVHRYCLDVLPDSFDEFVSWLCDDCKCTLKEQKQSGILDHGAIPSQTSHHEVPNNIKGFSGNGSKKIDLVVAETNNHVREDVSEQTYIACAKSDLVECGELASQHTPAPIEFPAGCLTQEKKGLRIKIKFKKIENNIRESTTEKDQDRLATASYDGCSKVDINKGTRLASDSSLPSKVKEVFQQKDQTSLSKHFESVTDLGTVISNNGPSRCSKEDGNAVRLPEDVNKRSQFQEEKVEGNLIEQMRRRIKITFKRREKKTSECTTEKDQGRLSTACNDECSKVDIIECTRSASDSTSPSEVKENVFFEQISKPIDAITDLDIASVPADHPGISSNGPSVGLKNDGNGIILPADVSNRSQLDKEKVEGNPIEPIELSAGSKVKENKCYEQEDETFVSKPFDSTTDLCIIAVLPSDNPVIDGSPMRLKNDGNGILLPEDVSKGSQLEEEKIDGNLIDPIALSTVYLKRKKKKKRKKNIMESTSVKDQHGLATASYVELVKEDIKECSRSAHDSTLPSKVKENEFCEQKDQTCISKPVEKTSDLGIIVVPECHPVIPNKGSSISFKNDGNDILPPADVSKRSQFEKENIEGNLIEPIELSVGCLKRKKKKKRKRTIMESTTGKDQHGFSTTSYDECVKADITVCIRSASDSTLPSKVKENKCSEQKELMCVSKPIDSSKQSQLEEENIVGNLIEPIDLSAGCVKRKKKKRKRTILESTAEKDQVRPATISFDEHVIVEINESTRCASDPALPSKVKENKCSEGKEHTCVSKPFDSTKQSHQPEEENIEGNLIEPIDVSAGCLKQKKKKKKKRAVMDSTAQKDHHGLATTSYDEGVKVDLTECSRSASYSTLAYQVKENKCCEQKDHMCVSEPFDTTKRSQLEEEKIEGNLIEPIDLSAGCLKQKKKKRKRTIMESTAEKDQHGFVTTSYDEHVKVDLTECAKAASDSSLPYKVKENKRCEQKDHMCVSESFDTTKRSQLEEEKIEGNLIEPIDLSVGCLKQKKRKKRKRTIMEYTAEKDQHGLVTTSYDEHVKVDLTECAKAASGSSLPYKVKENKHCEQKDHMCVSESFDTTKRSQLEEEKIEGNLIEPIDLSAGCLKQKKKKKRERTIMESTAEKDQHGLATTSYDEHVKVNLTECAKSESGSSLPYKVKENKCSEAKEHMSVSKSFDSTKRSHQSEEENIEGNLIEPIDVSAGCLKQKKKKKRKRAVMDSTAQKDQHGLATTSYDEGVKVDLTECSRSASYSTLAYEVKENKRCEQKDHMCVSEPFDTTKQSQLEEEKIEGNLIEPIDVSAGCLKQKKKKKRKRIITESTAEKDQHGLATTSYDEHVKVDLTECAKSASGSSLPYKVKENKCSEAKEHICVSKSFDSTKRSHQLEEENIEGNLIEPIDVSAGCLKQKKKKKRKRAVMDSTAQKDQHGLATTSYDEGVKVDISECTRSANGCSEQKDLKFVSKLFDSLAGCGISDVPADHPVTSSNFVQPVAVPVWRGSFSIWNENYDNIDLLVAHISNKACHKAYEATSQLQPVLRLEMRPKSDLWPTSFQTAKPNCDNIALYFLPSETSEQAFEQLVGEMIHKELAFRAFVQNAELLIFPSTELPLLYWTFRSKYYLWGVFRGKQQPPSSNALSSDGEFAEIPLIGKRCDDWSPVGPLNNSCSEGLLKQESDMLVESL